MLAGLGLLLANDFLFKPLFHNALTGKLSDFAGLFVFPLFWSALLPRRRREVYALTALGFVFWKSGHSQTLIDVWNSLGVLRVGRVVDPTDLAALAVLPFSYFYARRAAVPPTFRLRPARRRLATCAVVLVSLFAFTATQLADGQSSGFLNRKYIFRETTEEDLLARLSKLSARGVYLEERKTVSRDSYELLLSATFCKADVRASVLVYQQADDAVLELKGLRYRCDDPGGPERDRQLLAFFEEHVIAGLPPPASVEEVKPSRATPPTPAPSPPPSPARRR
jgi:hypothetical protein